MIVVWFGELAWIGNLWIRSLYDRNREDSFGRSRCDFINGKLQSTHPLR